MIYAITLAFIALDFITGLVKSISLGTFKSSVMREGLLHKSGELHFFFFCILIQYAETFLDLGFSLPVAAAICSYIVLMEIGSAIENIGTINPELVPAKLRGIIGLGGDDEE